VKARETATEREKAMVVVLLFAITR